MLEKRIPFFILLFLLVAQPAISSSPFESYIGNAAKLMASFNTLFRFFLVDQEKSDTAQKEYIEAYKIFYKYSEKLTDPSFFPSTIQQEKKDKIISLHNIFLGINSCLQDCFNNCTELPEARKACFSILVENKDFYQ